MYTTTFTLLRHCIFRSGGPVKSAAKVLCLVFALTRCAVGDDVEATLREFKIKFSRDSEGTIVAVEMPPQSGDRDLAVVQAISTISEITAPDCRASSGAIESLARLPKLSTLNLPGAQDANGYAYSVGKIKTLKSLSLAESSLTNHGLDDLCKSHPDLRELNVYASRIDNQAWPLILNLRELESLNISYCELQAYGTEVATKPKEPGPFARLAELPRLKRLVAMGIRMRSIDLRALAECCQLEHLLIDPHPANPKALVYLQECNPSLRLGWVIAQSLPMLCQTDQKGNLAIIMHCRYDHFMLLPITQLEKLESLTVEGANALAFLDSLPVLEDLTLVSLPKDRHELKHLRNARQLKSLRIERASIDEATAEILQSVTGLTAITLAGCEINSAASAKLDASRERLIFRVRP